MPVFKVEKTDSSTSNNHHGVWKDQEQEARPDDVPPPPPPNMFDPDVIEAADEDAQVRGIVEWSDMCWLLLCSFVRKGESRK